MKHEGAHFSLGPGTYRVPMRLHADNRRRLAERLRAKRRGRARRRAARGRAGAVPLRHRHRGALQAGELLQVGVRGEGARLLRRDRGRQRQELAVHAAAARGMGGVAGAASIPPGTSRRCTRWTRCATWTRWPPCWPASTPKPLYLLKGQNTDSGNWAQPARFDGIEKFDDRHERCCIPHIVECRRDQDRGRDRPAAARERRHQRGPRRGHAADPSRA